MHAERNIAAGASAILFVLAIWLLRYALPSVANRRPRLQE